MTVMEEGLESNEVPALRAEAVILFERYEQKDKSG
jgi:hypothetical protein